MPDSSVTDVLDQVGPTAPPRRNGELVFDAPWESRVFGLTMSAHRAGLFHWEEFRRLLIGEIREWESRRSGEGWSYYACWQAAFEKLLRAKGLCAPDELAHRVEALAARPAGHDHPRDRGERTPRSG
jgi:nitrile hydratase accessory protein